MNKTYLFYGFGAEYVLHPLYTAMKQAGHTCIEIDPLQTPDSIQQIHDMKDRNIIFVTSAHFLLNEKNFKYFYPTESHFYGTLEVMCLLKPAASVYIPHDLTQPVIDYEKEYLNQFTAFCTPCEPFTSAYAPYTQTKEMGWIKYQNHSNIIIPTHRAIWFISDFILHLKWGTAHSYRLLEPILSQGVSIKFPHWPGSDEFEEYFSQKGIHVYPSTENTIDLIHAHEIILTNGLSSLIAESYFSGKTTLNIKEGSHYGNDLNYLKILFPKLRFVDSIAACDMKSIQNETRPSVLKPFQMKNMVQFLAEL